MDKTSVFAKNIPIPSVLAHIQPPKSVEIPSGATHWQPSFTHPFVKVSHEVCDQYTANILNNEMKNHYLPDHITKIDRTRCYRLVDGQWMIERRQIFVTSTGGWQDDVYKPMDQYARKRSWRDDVVIELTQFSSDTPNSIRVQTRFGSGVIVGSDCGRTLVDLDDNPFSFRPCALYPHEIH